MPRVILTTSDSGAGCLRLAGLADVVIPFGFRFVWGRLPSATELATSFAPHPTQEDPSGAHWLDKFCRENEEVRGKGLGLLNYASKAKRSSCGSTRIRMHSCSLCNCSLISGPTPKSYRN